MRERTRLRTPLNREAGMSMIELMIAMVVLAIGLGALSSLFVLASATDNKNSRATSSALLAGKVIEQINAQNANVGTPIVMTDCAGNQWNVLGDGGAAPIGAGATLTTNAASPYYGGIDPTQAIGTVPAGYGMQFVDCAVNGRQGVYDVRWNVITLNQYARMITVTARQLGPSDRIGNKLFALPVTVRTIGGM
ncbi:MAG TPA: prepilin-type N-terminal cleavage/methylation domain-containing protein [Terriglobales bacterium]|jgi:prepilin-type N-terminal cleavage/methylation domain-containing protein|nr:prepilin-type N-terminal cleavage/methylation domain-containing protein [Terriglobales bacterium]